MRNQKGFTLIELLRARMSGNEASAIGSLRAINSGESTYASSCASGNYAVSLVDLALPPSGSTAGFVSPDLSSNGVTKSGYTVNIGVGTVTTPTVAGASTCNNSANAAAPTYFGEDHPTSIGSTGQRSFGSDQRGTIYQDNTGATWTAATVAAAVQTSAIQ
jgi:hypothetical protein